MYQSEANLDGLARLDAEGHWIMPPRDAYLAAKIRAWRETAPTDVLETMHDECPASPPPISGPGSAFDFQQRWAYFCSLLRREMMWHGLLPHWSIAFDNGQSRAGLCNFGTKQLSFSRNLVASATVQEMRNVILHEIAHALAGHKHGHDYLWRRIAVSIGCDGKRCHDLQLTRPRWVLCCSRGCWQVPRFKRSMSQLKRKCTKCNAVCVYKTFH